MDSSPVTQKTTIPNQPGTLANAQIPSHVICTGIPNMRDDDSLPANTNPPRQAPLVISTRQNSPPILPEIPTRSSSLGLKLTSLSSEEHAPPQQTRFGPGETGLPKKLHVLSGALGNINLPDIISSALDVADSNVPPTPTAMKELPNLPSTSPTSKRTRGPTISATAQQVMDMVLPRSPTIAQSQSTETPRQESGEFISNGLSMHRNSSSSSSPSFRVHMHPGHPPTSISRDSVQSTTQDSSSSSEDPASSSPVLIKTAESRKATAKQRRRMSFDFASLKQSQHSLPTLTSAPHSTMMQRSRSLWGPKVISARQPTVSTETIGILQEPMSERQRALNVKRARKMAQVRSISNLVFQVEILSREQTEGFRSRATLITIPGHESRR
jgi:hypothetical protein